MGWFESVHRQVRYNFEKGSGKNKVKINNYPIPLSHLYMVTIYKQEHPVIAAVSLNITYKHIDYQNVGLWTQCGVISLPASDRLRFHTQTSTGANVSRPPDSIEEAPALPESTRENMGEQSDWISEMIAAWQSQSLLRPLGSFVICLRVLCHLPMFLCARALTIAGPWSNIWALEGWEK